MRRIYPSGGLELATRLRGGFALELPSDYPLQAWGIHGFRVWAVPDGLWAAPVSDAGMWPAFYWRPGSLPSGWTLPVALRPLMTATMAALWRDLHIAGEEAVPRRQPAHPARPRASTTSPPPLTPRNGKPQRRVRTLPARSRRWLALSGSHHWGSPEERQIIRRRAHGVRGHLRRLPAGWHPSDEAKEIARLFGLPIPDGYTFVRPHVRGGGALDVQPGTFGAAPVVQARGLAAVMSLLSPDR